MKTLVAIVALAFLAACGDNDNKTTPEARTQLLGTTVGTGGSGPSVLVELNPTTGELVKTIGTVGYAVNGLEYDASRGKLFATTAAGDPNFPSGLLAIDMATGAGTTIGSGTGTTTVNVTVNKAGKMYSWTEDSDDLVSLSTTSGLATVVGDSGVDSYTHGLAFDNRDRLWLVNGDEQIYAIDLATGIGSATGSLGSTAHHGDFHPDTGKYWGIDSTSNPRHFVVADIDAATITTTMAAMDDLHAITFKK